MKTNGDMNQGGQLLPEHRAAWAEHYVLFIKALQAEGFSVWGLTVQNEPEARQQWDSCLYTAEQERDFIRDYLGPALHAAGLFPVRILCWDHNRDNLYHRAHTILGDPEAARYVWGSGFHWHTDDCFDNVQAVHEPIPTRAWSSPKAVRKEGPIEVTGRSPNVMLVR